uniref:SG1-2 n=1 Tax=Anopheles epiroticus TaxID=199890 RepID=A0A182PT35_9DIPT
MVSQAAKLWAPTLLLLLASQHRWVSAESAEEKSPLGSHCLSEAGAVLHAPAITCEPLAPCDSEAILKSYHNLYQQCRINASSRTHERDNFLFRLNYWQGDHVFLYEMVQQAHAPVQEVLQSPLLAQQSPNLVPELQRKLLIYSIEAGRIEEALILHLTLKGQWKPKQIVDEIESGRHVNVAIVEHLLDFIRAIPVRAVRSDFYKALAPVMRRYSMATTYVTLLFAGDATGVLANEKERTDYISQQLTVFVHKMREQLRNLQFDYNLWLAERFPRYYTLYFDEIFFFSPPHWPTTEKRRLFEIAGLFKHKGHRFAAIDRFLTFVHQYDSRNRANLERDVPTLARELERLRQTIAQTGNDKQELDRLKKLEEKFVNKKERWNRHNHRSYLHIIKSKGKFGADKMEMERMG